MQNGPQRPREVFFYLHSVIASREAMSAVPEIWRRYGASISGAHRRVKSANFADLVSGLKRLRSAPRPASRHINVQASGLPQAAARGTLNADVGGPSLHVKRTLVQSFRYAAALVSSNDF
jgi:hypothetical protein